jgi:hypothetical protein
VTDWYVSSAAHAAVPVFAVSTAYTVGQFVRRITSTPKAQWVMRVTTAGTSAASEPTWPSANNGTVTSGGAVFTNVTGQSTYGWSAAAGDLPTLLGAVGTFRFAGGDRLFVSSDHAETQTTTTSYGSGGAATASYAIGQVLSVNRAGSVPPVAADLTAGATVTVGTGGVLMNIDSAFPVYYYGISYIYTGTSTAGIAINGSPTWKSHYFDGCQLYLNTATTNVKITNNGSATCIFNNTTLRFGHASQSIQGSASSVQPIEIIWLNTASAIAGATIPTSLFTPTNATPMFLVTARGVDLSAITGNLFSTISHQFGCKLLFDSCRIASSATRFNQGGGTNTRDLVELINCYDGTNIINESWQTAGAVTTERTITLSGGATDDVGIFSHKMVSGTNIDKYANPLLGFWMDVEYQTTGASKTATVEIISSASLNNDEISLMLEYQGTSGSPVASMLTTMPATVLTTPAAVTTSTATWNSSPATPVKQMLQVTFTPQLAGRVRGQVRLGKASTTCYYNPVITIT